MRLVLFILLGLSVSAFKLNLEDCKEETIGDMDMRVCSDIEPYSKVYFHDPTGENQVTIVPNRLYKNHGYYVAYSAKDKLYIASKKYEKETWFQNYDLLNKAI